MANPRSWITIGHCLEVIAGELSDRVPRTQTALVAYARDLGIHDAKEVGEVLKPAGFAKFEKTNWEAMKNALATHAVATWG